VARSAQQIAVVGALLLCFGALSVANATACDCASPGSACTAANRANIVFVGRVTGFTDGVQFDVERTVAGVPLGSITVGNGPGNCALNFTVGGRYVVYAHRDRSGMLFTNMCTRTRPVNDPHTRADIAYFDRRERNTPGGLLTGVVNDVTVDLSSIQASLRPLAGVRITVSAETGGGPARTTLTRSDGSYELTGLPPGRLRITASLPSQFEPLFRSPRYVTRHLHHVGRRPLARSCRTYDAHKRGGVPRPRLAAVTYAATSILIRLGLASSRSGSRTVSTPAWYWALTLPASTVGGSVNVRANAP
jgi:hypothetical protein